MTVHVRVPSHPFGIVASPLATFVTLKKEREKYKQENYILIPTESNLEEIYMPAYQAPLLAPLSMLVQQIY